MAKNKSSTGWIARSSTAPKMIYCTDGEFHHENQCGPGMFCARVYMSEKVASKVRGGTVTVEKIKQGMYTDRK